MSLRPAFDGDLNIILKIPNANYEQTLLFYTDVLGFELIEDHSSTDSEVEKSYYCKLGPTTWHFEQVSGFTKPDIWLQLRTSDLSRARKYLDQFGVIIRDRVSMDLLPDTIRVTDPSGNMLILSE